MIFRKQLGLKDCFRTVIGCITDTEPQDVPDFMALEPESEFISQAVHEDINQWLSHRGLDLISIAYPTGDKPLQTLLDYIAETQGKDIVYLLTGKSVIEAHVVICRGNQIIWDPSPVNSWIRGPLNGSYFVQYISKSFMRYNGPVPENQNPFDIGADDNEDQISV